jgi:hypothetical protein
MSKLWTRSTWGLLALALIFSGAAHAAQTAAPKKATAVKKAPAVHEVVSTGTITSIDATQLVMTHKVKGKDESVTLVLTPETKRMGTLAAGSKVSVQYRMENSDRVATSVRARTVAAKTTKAKTTAAKKS